MEAMKRAAWTSPAGGWFGVATCVAPARSVPARNGTGAPH